MGEAFFGYLLPWGQMSYWGAQVITSLFGAIPKIGPGLTEWIRGDYSVSDATLNRFFAFHVVLMPLLILGLVGLHIVALRRVGSNNPDGIEIKENKGPDGIPVDGIPFHPYYTIKDLFGYGIFLLIFAAIVFYAPELGGWFLESNNFIPADQLKTPEEIAPLWYLTPFYAILRAVPDKLGGIIAMALAIFLPFLLPWLDRSPVKSIRYRGLTYKIMMAAFVISFLGLGYLGTERPGGIRTLLAQIFSVIYFAFFLLMPVYSRFDKNKTAPDRLQS
jgi:ubiquinol-cytochrome c reductase cytochrome b subunit